MKAPRLKTREQFQNWARRFTSFLEQYQANWPLFSKPTSPFVAFIPDTQEEAMRIGFVSQALFRPILPVVGYVLTPQQRADFDDQVDAYMFANQALSEAIQDFAEASAVVSAVQWPNVTAAWAALLRRFTPTTHLDRFALTTQFEALAQRAGESVQDYGSRAMALQIKMLQVSGQVDELAFVFRFVNGLKELSQSQCYVVCSLLVRTSAKVRCEAIGLIQMKSEGRAKGTLAR
jgi:hypothetical protein